MSSRVFVCPLLGLLLTFGSLASMSCAGPGRAVPLRDTASRELLPIQIAEGLRERSPVVDDSDVAARDQAGEKLAGFGSLLEAAGDKIAWGGYDPARGFDLKAYTLTEFLPIVWARVYLSTFMFPGSHTLRREGKYTVIELPAKFRVGLPPGDYAYPLWHSKEKWEAHVNIESLLLVFERDRLVAALRKSATNPPPIDERLWDGRWRWTDEGGAEQPRVALFTYLFSPGNPMVAALESRYRTLEQAFRNENCTSCHAPDNQGKASRLLLLDFPNQALVGRHELVEVLKENKMPPPNKEEGRHAGIDNEETRQNLIRLARAFESAADSALAYDRALAAVGGSRQ